MKRTSAAKSKRVSKLKVVCISDYRKTAEQIEKEEYEAAGRHAERVYQYLVRRYGNA